MNTVVYIPFAASLVVAGLSRLGSARLWPRAAMWAITTAAAGLAVSTAGALALLASPLPAQVPWVATLGRWQPHAVAAHSPVPPLVSAAALVLLLVLAWRLVRELGALVGEARDAALLAAVVGGAKRRDLVIVDDRVPGAHAVGLGISGRGAVIVSSAILELLDGDEQAAVIAHERAHLCERHTLFMTAVRLASALNPLAATMTGDLQFALERSADEAAATTTERAVVASALAKAALGTLDVVPAPAFGLAFHPHALTARVAALLAAPNRRARPAWALIAIAFGATLALGWATHDTERFFEAVRLWSHP